MRCTLKGHQATLRCLAFSPQGDYLASAEDGDGKAELRLWEVAAPENVVTLDGPHLSTLAFSPDGRTFAAGGIALGAGRRPAEVWVWDFPSRRLRFTARHNAPHASCSGLAFSPNGKVLAAAYAWNVSHQAASAQIELLDAASGRHQCFLDGHSNAVRCVAFSPDGKMLVSGGADPKVRAWESSTGKLLGTLPHDDEVAAAVFTPDGRKLVTAQIGQFTSVLQVWNPAIGKIQRSLEDLPGSVAYMALVPNGQSLQIVSDNGTFRTWDLDKREAIRTMPGHRPAEAWSVAFTPDGRTLVSAGDDHKIRLWDTASGDEKCVLSGHASLVSCLAISPGGEQLASGSYDHTVRLWDLKTGSASATLAGHTDAVRCVAFSPNGQMLASAGKDHAIRLWDVQAKEVRRVFEGHDYGIRAVSFSPDGKTLASASEDESLRLWDVASGHPRLVLREASQIWSAAFSPDGDSVAAGIQDGSVILRDVVTGKKLAQLVGHLRGVWAVAFNPDGKTLASASDDQTVRLWQTATGTEMLSLRGPPSRANSIAFSSDGRSLAAAYHDGTLVLWRADDEATDDSAEEAKR